MFVSKQFLVEYEDISQNKHYFQGNIMCDYIAHNQRFFQIVMIRISVKNKLYMFFHSKWKALSFKKETIIDLWKIKPIWLRHNHNLKHFRLLLNLRQNKFLLLTQAFKFLMNQLQIDVLLGSYISAYMHCKRNRIIVYEQLIIIVFGYFSSLIYTMVLNISRTLIVAIFNLLSTTYVHSSIDFAWEPKTRVSSIYPKMLPKA